MGNLKQLLNSRSQVSRGLLNLWRWGRFAGEFGHEAAVSPDGIRLRRGLLEKRSQTLPPGRVQAVRLRQPMLWRLKGWWRVQVNVAGYGGGEEGESAVSAQTVLLPVGPREDALTALWLVLKDIGTDDPFATIDAALEGHGEASGFLTSPRRVRVLPADAAQVKRLIADECE